MKPQESANLGLSRRGTIFLATAGLCALAAWMLGRQGAMTMQNAVDPPPETAASLSRQLDAWELSAREHWDAAEEMVRDQLRPMPIIRPGDSLEIGVLEALPGRPIEGEHLVRPDGTIGLGSYGDLKVAGLNRVQIKEKLAAHLRKYMGDEALGLVRRKEDGQTIAIPAAESDRLFVGELVRQQDPDAASETHLATTASQDAAGSSYETTSVPHTPNLILTSMQYGGSHSEAGGMGEGGTDGGFTKTQHVPCVLPPGDERSEATWELLQKDVEVNFSETPLKEAIQQLMSFAAGEDQVPPDFYLDPLGIADVGATVDAPVTISFHKVPIRMTLRLILREHDLSFVIRDGLIIISAADTEDDFWLPDPEVQGAQ